MLLVITYGSKRTLPLVKEVGTTLSLQLTDRLTIEVDEEGQESVDDDLISFARTGSSLRWLQVFRGNY